MWVQTSMAWGLTSHWCFAGISRVPSPTIAFPASNANRCNGFNVAATTALATFDPHDFYVAKAMRRKVLLVGASKTMLSWTQSGDRR